MAGMTVADTVGTDTLQEQAHRHLLMHFTRNGAFGPDGKPLLVLERGEGAYVFDTDGKRYFDGLSSLFCCQIGYSFGEEMAAVASAQMSTLAFNTNWATAHPPAIQLAAALAERAPGDLNRVFFTNGGSESVEAAWKIVRQHYLAKGEPQRTKAIAREIAYHGVTLGALSFTGVRPMKEPFGAAPIPVVRISNTNALPRPGRRGRRRALRAAAGRGRAHDRRGRAGDGGDADRRAGPERRRLPRPARRLLAGAARAVRQVRDRAGRRRGHHRLRAHRRVVRVLALRRRAGPDHLRQGHHVGLRADGRGDRQRPDRRAALRGGPDADARHHVRRAPGGGGDRAAQHRDLRARGRARERARARAVHRRAARGHQVARADRRRRPRRRVLLGAGAGARRGRSRASRPRSARSCCAASSPAGCSRRA